MADGPLDNEEIQSALQDFKGQSPDGSKEKEKEADFIDLHKEPEFVDPHKPSEFGDSQKNRDSGQFEGFPCDPVIGRSSGLPAPPEAGQSDRKEEKGAAAEDVDEQYEVVRVNEAVSAMPPRDEIYCNCKGSNLYKQLFKWVLTEKQLQENGYPRPDPKNSSTAKVYTTRGLEQYCKRANLKKNEKICVRCGKHFMVDPNGSYAYQEVCIYHGREVLKEMNAAGYIQRMYYSCCGKDCGVEGCQFAQYHVHESNKWENRTGYLRTLSCPPLPNGDYGVYAMDCEMVYTEGGLELAHITVTDCNNKPVYETFVQPDTKVIDYNTRFSGITAKKMEGVTTTIRDVQGKLCSLIKEKTILIGHSLECDLTAVKLIHDTVVDTAVVFLDHSGPVPYKRALKTLAAEYLKKTIQDDVGGHDSREDAISCMELMQWQIKKDAPVEPRCG